MVKFSTTIPTSSPVYKAIDEAVDLFLAKEGGHYYVVGTLMIDGGKFIGAVVNDTTGEKIRDILSPPVPEAPPTPMMTAKGAAFTYGDMIKAGWTNELLLEHGYIEDDVPW